MSTRQKNRSVVSILKQVVKEKLFIWKESISNSKKRNEEKWSKKFELHYWEKTDEDVLIRTISDKYKYMKVDEVIEDHLSNKESLRCIDVGGGGFGGGLRFIGDCREKILFDNLGDNFVERRKKEFDSFKIRVVNGDFTEMPFSTNYFDVGFCWEALDHCNDTKSFYKAQNELKRIMNKGGLLFFEMPIRIFPIDGHPIALSVMTRDDIISNFVDKFDIIKKIKYGPSFGSPYSFYLLLKKVT